MDIALPLAGVMTLWLGLLDIGEKAGAIEFVAKLIGPFFSRIFPEVPRNDPASGHMVMNFSANFLGWTTLPRHSASKPWTVCKASIPIRKKPATRKSCFWFCKLRD